MKRKSRSSKQLIPIHWIVSMNKDFSPDGINTYKDNLTKIAARFRAAIEKCDTTALPCIGLHNFPRGACGDAALLLAEYLQENKCGEFNYVLGERKGYSHAWLQRASLIVDITADQFEDQEAAIIVTEDHTWHSQFKGKVQNVADFRKYKPDSFVSEMERTYKAILEKVEI